MGTTKEGSAAGGTGLGLRAVAPARRSGVASVARSAAASGAAVLALLAVPGAQAQVVVSDSGQAGYRYPIKVPPGVGGFAPELAIVYDGVSTGVLGKGWRIEGIPQIQRCQATRSVDGSTGLVRHNVNDKLCLNGERMIQTSSAGAPLAFPQYSDASAGREFRLERDRLVRIRSSGQVEWNSKTYSGPATIKVWTRNGTVQTHSAVGSSGAPGAVATAPDNTKAVVGWPFVTETDRAGNEIFYRQSGWGPWSAIEAIGYNGLVPYSADSYRSSVTFVYEILPAASNARRESFYRGVPNALGRRLTSIDIKPTQGSVTRRIKLNYDTFSTSGINRLVSIAECVGPTLDNCLPATRFSYTPGSFNLVETLAAPVLGESAMGYYSASSGQGQVLYVRALTGDFNGDGRTDIVVPNSSSGYSVLHLSSAGGGHSSSNIASGDQLDFAPDSAAGVAIVVDFDGDGLDDIFVYRAPGTWSEPPAAGCQSYSFACVFVLKSNGNGTFTKVTVQQLELSRNAGSISVQAIQGAGANRAIYATVSGYSNFILGDFNRDGKLDIVRIVGSGSYGEVGSSQTPAVQCMDPSTCSVQLMLGNGDGSFTASIVQLFNGWVPYVQLSRRPLAPDVNGDGVPDIVYGGQVFTAQDGSSATARKGYIAGRIDGSFEIDAVYTDPDTGLVTVAGLLPDCQGGATGDFNGDGLPDQVCGSTGSTRLSWTGLDYVASATALEVACQFGDCYSPEVIGALDVDGDGRADLLVDYSDGMHVFRLQGSGNFGNPSAAALRGVSGSTWYRLGRHYLVGNFTGGGGTEFLVLGSYGDHRLFAKTDPLPPDMLLSVTDPNGSVTTITYESLIGTSRYARDRGTADAPSYPIQEPKRRQPDQAGPSRMASYRLVDTVPPQFVVTSISTDTGVGTSKTTTEMAYRGFRTDLLGRGALGFREIRRQTDSPDGTSKLTNVQLRLRLHPYTGAIAVSETYLGALSAVGQAQTGLRLSRTENTYCDLNAASGAEATATPFAPCPTTSKLQRPYLRKSVATAVDLTGTALPTTTTINTYSGGYLTQVDTQTVGTSPAGQQTFSGITTNEYFPDDITGEKWLLGLLKKTTASKTVPNSLGSITTSAGSAPKATATAGP